MRVEASVVIDRPRGEVFEYLATPSNTSHYFAHIVAYDATSPLPLREGTTMAGKWRSGLLRYDMNQVITKAVAHEVIEWTDLNEHLPTVQSFTLSDVDGSTRVIYRVNGTAQDLIGRAAAPLLEYVTQRDAWTSLDRLKGILETRTPTA